MPRTAHTWACTGRGITVSTLPSVCLYSRFRFRGKVGAHDCAESDCTFSRRRAIAPRSQSTPEFGAGFLPHESYHVNPVSTGSPFEHCDSEFGYLVCEDFDREAESWFRVASAGSGPCRHAVRIHGDWGGRCGLFEVIGAPGTDGGTAHGGPSMSPGRLQSAERSIVGSSSHRGGRVQSTKRVLFAWSLDRRQKI